MRSALFCAIAVLAPWSARADVSLGPATIVFANVEQGGEALGRHDEYADILSPLDLAVRLKSTKDLTPDDYLTVARESVVEWSADEKTRLTKILESMQERGRLFAAALPPRVLLVKTSGAEESGAAYTRGDAIALQEKRLKESDAGVEKLLWHELFHVLSRYNPELRNRLYAVIGFEHCGPVELPADLAARKITNPDAPHHEHCVQVRIDDEPQWVTPILTSTRGREQAADGASFFQFIKVELLLLDRDASAARVRAQTKDGAAVTIDFSAAPDIFTKIGRNTGYIIHPEEITADNFALAAVEAGETPNPEIPAKIREILTADAAAR
jgi:hypothetical protein